MALSDKINKLISAIGGSSQPTLTDIKGMLVRFSHEAKAMEEDQATAEAEAKIANLQSEIERANKAMEAVKAEHQSELETVKQQHYEHLRTLAEERQEERNEPPDLQQDEEVCLSDAEGRVCGTLAVGGPAAERSVAELLQTGDVAASLLLQDLAGSGLLTMPETDSTPAVYMLTRKAKIWLSRNPGDEGMF